jgi:hypothetical protein
MTQANQRRGRARELSGAAPGDERTPSKPIGEVRYADRQRTDTKRRDDVATETNKAARRSALEGPAAYAPHDPDETKRLNRKKSQPR